MDAEPTRMFSLARSVLGQVPFHRYAASRVFNVPAYDLMRSYGSVGDRKPARDNKKYNHDALHCMALLRDFLNKNLLFRVLETVIF
jgi:hypothetical protein